MTASLDLLFPPHCLHCSQRFQSANRGICQGCREKFWDQQAACPRCARPLPDNWPVDDRCPACRQKNYRFDGTIALGVYGEELRDLVLRIKQPQEEVLTLAVGRLLGERCLARRKLDPTNPAWCSPFDYICPVPAHWRRRLIRGGNTADLLAEGMAARLGIAFPRRLLVCRRKVKKQGTLMPTERRRNVRQAYRLRKGYDMKGKHLLLVDDVMTTGATAHEIARLCKRAGVAKVTVAVVARGIGFD